MNDSVHRVTSAIANLRPLYMKFLATEKELVQTQREFYKIAAFPRTIGAIDCPHIKICSLVVKMLKFSETGKIIFYKYPSHM